MANMTFCKIFLLLQVVAVSGAIDCECGRTIVTNRILGGRSALKGTYPWMGALVRTYSKQIFCGSSLINSRFVLTAGHCMTGQDVTSFHVALGETDISNPPSSSLYRASRIFTHPKFSGPPNYSNDLALIELEREVNLTDGSISSVCLPQPGPSFFGILYIAGWGLTSAKGQPSTFLQEATIVQQSQRYCTQVYGVSKFTSNHVCANSGRKSVCNGDSGGPLMVRQNGKTFVVGVVSYGTVCGDPRYPAVFTKTQSYLNWIFSTTASGQYCPK